MEANDAGLDCCDRLPGLLSDAIDAARDGAGVTLFSKLFFLFFFSTTIRIATRAMRTEPPTTPAMIAARFVELEL